MKFIQKNAVWLISLLAYAILLTMSVWFFRERLNVDTSYYFFKTVNEKGVHIEHDRLVLALAELPVLLGVYFHLPLKTIACIYSVWHVLFFLIIAFLLAWRYRRAEYLLLFLLLQIVGIQYGFVCPVFEQYYGTALLAAMFIVLSQTKKINIANGLLVFILAFLGIGSHPFNIILFTLLIFLDFEQRKNKKILFAMLSLVPLWLLFKYFHISEYEKGKVSWIFDIVHNKTYRKLGEWSHWKSHFIFLWQYYCEICLACPLSIFLALKMHAYRSLLWELLFLVATLLLINFSYAVSEYSGYNEQVCYILVPLVLIPLFVIYLNQLHSRPLQIFLFLSCLIIIPFRFKVQIKHAQINARKTLRVESWIAEARQKRSCKNYVMAASFADISQVTGWDISYSSLIFSAFDHQLQQVSIVPIEEKVSTAVDSIGKDAWLFRFGEVEQIGSLNSAYFRLCDQQRYEKLDD